MIDTVNHAFQYLNGNIFNFYEVNKTLSPPAVYMPSTYIIFALWGLPVKIFTDNLDNAPFAIFWFKLLTTLFWAGSLYLVYKILRLNKTSEANSKIAVGLIATSPVIFFSQFLFGQYDSLTLYFVLLGTYLFFQEKTFKGALAFGLGISLKYHAFLIFLPLLLIREKKAQNVFKAGFVALLPTILFMLPYLKSPAFKENVLQFEGAGRILSAQFVASGPYAIYPIFLFLFGLICFYCYLKDFNNDEEKNLFSLYVSYIVYAVMFSLIAWNPQWPLVLMPFLTLMHLMSEKRERFLMIEVFMCFAFFGFNYFVWPGNTDEMLMLKGLFSEQVPFLGIRHIKSVYLKLPTPIYFTLFSTSILIFALYKTMVKEKLSFNFKINDTKALLKIARIRFYFGLCTLFFLPLIIVLMRSYKYYIE